MLIFSTENKLLYVVFFLQYVVVPPRRSTAEAFQILISHMLGDAGSPYLVGVVSFMNYLHYNHSIGNLIL